MAKEDIAKGPVGAKMVEMLRTPSFAKGLSPSILFDLAKDKGLITPEQQADFKSRVGKDRTALQDFKILQCCSIFTDSTFKICLLFWRNKTFVLCKIK